VEFCGGGVQGVEGRCDERVSGAGWQECVDVACGAGAGDRSQSQAREGFCEELGGEGDGESSGDEGAVRVDAPTSAPPTFW
jgi:hypothetical protein